MVEGNSLENYRARKGTEGSNPSPSARINSLVQCFNSREGKRAARDFGFAKALRDEKNRRLVSLLRRGTQVAQGDGLLNH